jgi:hypothetical protein
MRWSDITTPPTSRKLREFAAAAAVASLALAAWQAYRGSLVFAGACLALAVAASACGIWRPRWLAPLLTAAMVLAFPIGWTVSLLVLAVLFYGVVTPIGLALRLFGRDPLNRKLPGPYDSYWEAKPQAENQQRYLRQY